MKRLILSAVLLLTALSVSAQGEKPQPLAADPELHYGKLDNGMSYYIRRNTKQKNLADFYIYHDVGAIQEDDDQQGLAHFLEHMAFQGTKNLPGKSMTEYLEKVGVKFGNNLNAATSFNMTRYLMRDVPTTREGIIDTALLVLHDWSGFISLEPKAIDSERGVIMEELRTRDNAGWRAYIAEHKAVHKGTKYERRNLIGYLDGLKSFDHSSLRNFYHKWYRPEYQAVLIVGDIDPDAVEAKLKKLMADIPASPADAAKKEVINVPDNEEPIIAVLEDPEEQSSSVSVMVKHVNVPRNLANTAYMEKIQLMEAVGRSMVNSRLDEIKMKADAPFTSAFYYERRGLCPTLARSVFTAICREGKVSEGAESILTEMERIKRYGFTEGEFERAKADVKKQLEMGYKNRNDRTNQYYINFYSRAFIDNYHIASAETEWQIDSLLIEKMPLEAVNRMYKTYLTDRNRVIFVNTPKKDGLKNPNEAEILSLIAKVRTAQINPYEDTVVREPLIAEGTVLKGSAVKKTEQDALYGTTTWTLKNGMKIIVKPTRFKAGEVLLSLRAHAGTTVLEDEEMLSADLLPSIVDQQGISKFSAADLKKLLAGKDVSLDIKTGRYSTAVSGDCAPDDLETLLQLIYLGFTSPRFDENDFESTVNSFRDMAANRMSHPDFKFETEIDRTLYADSPRFVPMTPETLQSVTLERVRKVYSKLFSSARAYTLTIVGNVDLVTLKPLVEKYIGSLPMGKTAMKFTDDSAKHVRGNVVNDFRTPMIQPKVSLYREYYGDEEYTIKNVVTYSILGQILSTRYRTAVREEKGGTYGVRTRCRMVHDFAPHYVFSIKFDTNEAMADELSQIIVDGFRKMADEGPTDLEVDKIRKFMLKLWKKGTENNSQWMQLIDMHTRYGLNHVSEYENALVSVSADDIKSAAKKILGDGNMAYVVMRPEKK